MRICILSLPAMMTAALASAAPVAAPADIVRILAPGPGSTVVVTGPGAGDLIRPVSQAVGPSGSVFVVESDGAMLENLRRRIEAERIGNAFTVPGNASGFTLPRRASLVVLYNAYHHIETRSDYLGALRRSLAPQGVVAVLDYYRRPMKIGPPWRERVSSSRALSEMQKAGFRLIRRHNDFSAQYLMTFTPKR